MNALKCRTFSANGDVTHAQNVNSASRKLTHMCVITSKRLCTAGSAIALTRAVHMLLLPHAGSGVSLYIEQEN